MNKLIKVGIFALSFNPLSYGMDMTKVLAQKKILINFNKELKGQCDAELIKLFEKLTLEEKKKTEQQQQVPLMGILIYDKISKVQESKIVTNQPQILDLTDFINKQQSLTLIQLTPGTTIKYGDQIFHLGPNGTVQMQSQPEIITKQETITEVKHSNDLESEQKKEIIDKYNDFFNKNFSRSEALTKRLEWLTEQRKRQDITQDQKNNYLGEAIKTIQEANRIACEEKMLRYQMQQATLLPHVQDSKKQKVIREYREYAKKLTPRVNQLLHELKKCETDLITLTDIEKLVLCQERKTTLDKQWSVIRLEIEARQEEAKKLGISREELIGTPLANGGFQRNDLELQIKQLKGERRECYKQISNGEYQEALQIKLYNLDSQIDMLEKSIKNRQDNFPDIR